MVSSEVLSAPSRPMRVNINDLLNPVDGSGSEGRSPTAPNPSPSSTNVSTHISKLSTHTSFRDLPYEHSTKDRADIQRGSTPELNIRHRHRDAWHDGHAHVPRPDERSRFNLSGAQWMARHANAEGPRLDLPPPPAARQVKVEPWQMAPLSASLLERQYAGDADPDSGVPSNVHNRAVRSSVIQPSPSPTSSSRSSFTGFAASLPNAAPTLTAIPHSPYGHHQQRAAGLATPVTFGPHAYAHHPHQEERPHLAPLVKLPSVHSSVMLSPVTPTKNEYDAASATMAAVDISRRADHTSSRLTSQESVSRDVESAGVLQLHPTDTPQQNAMDRKRTRSRAELNSEDGMSHAPRSSSLSSSSSRESTQSNSGGRTVDDDARRSKKVRGKTKEVSTAGYTGISSSNQGGKASKKQSGGEEYTNEAAGLSISSKKGKEKEKGAVSSSNGHASGLAQPLDPQMTVRLGYGVGVVPVREGVPVVLGYPHYQVPMHMHPLGVPVAVATSQNHNFNGKWFPELQYARCMSARYKSDPFPRCVSCTRRWAGDTCRFQNIRILLRDANKMLWAVGFQDLSAKGQSAQIIFPDQWNVKLEERHVLRTMETVATSLLPHLQKEQIHQQLGSVVKRQRETDVRATCDTCMTSLFSSSWMCRQCGREACEECYNTIRRLTADPNPATSPASNGKGKNGASGADQRTLKERHAQANPFFLSCNRKAEHGVHTFVPVTRFVKAELDEAVLEMERLVKKDAATFPCNGNDVREGEESQESMTIRSKEVGEKTAMEVDGARMSPLASDSTVEGKREDERMSEICDENLKESVIPEHYNDGVCTLVENPIPPSPFDIAISSSRIPPTSDVPLETPSWPVPYYTAETLTEPVFASQWARGTPLVVSGLLDRLNLRWTPEYFSHEYGTQSCIILECQTDANKKVTVGEFFSSFGKYERRPDCWKLKDWPPSTDFKTAFPELYEDFNRAVPMPSYSRRDGAFNIASHFPTNTLAPDLGPKMYNAFASSEAPGSKGSTRLHMDMADAVNVMVHSEMTPDGAPGCAAWDIFRAEDSCHLRNFFKKNFKGKYHNDPIHAQQFYLDTDLRSQLYREFGVRSFRIYQRPGEAVFIPAGCAHQVCNFADCIKVACDFVSPENVERCEALTREFRAQNQSLVWKEDVLQLRSMMWFAWLSCRRQQDKWRDEEGRILKRSSPGATVSQNRNGGAGAGQGCGNMDCTENGPIITASFFT